MTAPDSPLSQDPLSHPLPALDDGAILRRRPTKNHVDQNIPYAFLVEPERSSQGAVESVATIFLTNRECPFRCTMCDLWKNTLDRSVPTGAIPRQIEYALERLPTARTIKLYNSGNFFDAKAIPRQDWPTIAKLVAQFDRVIVENHPKLCGPPCLEFRDLIDGQLEVALGLETIHPEILPWLNKQMSLDDFQRAAGFLTDHQIDLRSFILLRPPGLSEQQGVDWAVRSVQFAQEQQVGVCAIVPTRGGNGVMEHLEANGVFAPPNLTSMETSLESCLANATGRVFMDLWDAEQFARCDVCVAARVERLRTMNESQTVPPPINCENCRNEASIDRGCDAS